MYAVWFAGFCEIWRDIGEIWAEAMHTEKTIIIAKIIAKPITIDACLIIPGPLADVPSADKVNKIIMLIFAHKVNG